MVANYSDSRKANALAALVANDGNLSRTSSELGIPRTTLRHWRDGELPSDVADLGQVKRGDLAAKLEEVAWALAGAIEGKIPFGTLQHTAVALGIVIDKIQLLHGKPTSITDDRSLSDAELDAELAAALAAARASAPGGTSLSVESSCSP